MMIAERLRDTILNVARLRVRVSDGELVACLREMQATLERLVEAVERMEREMERRTEMECRANERAPAP